MVDKILERIRRWLTLPGLRPVAASLLLAALIGG